MGRILLLGLIVLLTMVGCAGADSGGGGSPGATLDQVWPLGRGTTPDTLADPYGPRILSGAYDFHRGLDIRADAGTPVYAVAKGKVVRAKHARPRGALKRFGNFLVIAHDPLPDGTVRQTAYLHLSGFAVSRNQTVRTGQLIGYVGNSGVGINTEHLHLDYYLGLDDGRILRRFSRNPLRILPYTHRDPAITIAKTASRFSVTITEAPGSVDIVRIVFKPKGLPDKIIDFETREGLNSANEDENPHGGVTITPGNFNSSSSSYQLILDYHADFSAVTQCAVDAIDIAGGIHTKTMAC